MGEKRGWEAGEEQTYGYIHKDKIFVHRSDKTGKKKKTDQTGKKFKHYLDGLLRWVRKSQGLDHQSQLHSRCGQDINSAWDLFNRQKALIQNVKR